jgi:hypothetical protein
MAEQTYPIVDLTQPVPEADFPGFMSQSRANPAISGMSWFRSVTRSKRS